MQSNSLNVNGIQNTLLQMKGHTAQYEKSLEVEIHYVPVTIQINDNVIMACNKGE